MQLRVLLRKATALMLIMIMAIIGVSLLPTKAIAAETSSDYSTETVLAETPSDYSTETVLAETPSDDPTETAISYPAEDAAIPAEDVEGASERNGWYVTKAGARYYFVHNEKVTGWQTIHNRKYYFTDLGRMAAGWRTINGKRYYLHPEKGFMLTGFRTIQNKKYYLHPEKGVMLTGWRTINDKVRYFDTKTGVMAEGPKEIKGKLFYFKTGGSGVRLKYSGWKKLDGKWYYFNSNGTLKTGWLKDGGNWYFLNSDGAMKTGWYKDSKGDKYYLKTGNSGKMMIGWQEIKGKHYFFKNNGIYLSNIKWDSVCTLAEKQLDACGGTLRAAFNWSAFLSYVPEEPYSKDVSQYARWAFENKKADCYGKANTFCYMARALGYEAHFVQGYVLNSSGGKELHGWVEIESGGETYVCDPSFHGAQAKYGRTGYFIQYGQKDTWVYVDYKRVN